MKGYKLYDSTTHSIFVSRDVFFYEKEFPFFGTFLHLSGNPISFSCIDDPLVDIDNLHL